MAPVHAVARVSAAAGRAGGLDLWVVNALRRIAEATDGSAVLGGQGWGRYADVAAVRGDDTALDAVVARWFRITTDALTPRLAVTGRSLLTAAGDCLILTAAAATTLTAATELGQLDRTTARTALGPLAASHQAWRAVARWPAGVRLDGEQPGEQLAASRELRQRVTDLLRDGGDWRPAAALHQEVPLDQLLTTMRRTLHAVANVAVAHYEAMDALVRGPGRLWIAPAAMADRAERSRTILEHGRRGGLVPMPAHEPTARLLLNNTRAALTSSVEATAALDRTAGLRGPSPDADPQQPERLQPRPRRAHEDPIRLSALPGDRAAPRLPVQGVVAVLIRRDIGSPVLFRQARPGRHGEIFTLVKFRTMRAAAPGEGVENDGDRLTPLGRRLRAASLDELPTLVNVIRGDMSLVGPRPLLVEYLDRYTPEQARRHEVRPGVTGLAQVSGRNALTWEEKFALDVQYVDSHTFLGDLRILWRTIAPVFGRRGIAADGVATMSEFRGPPDA